MKFINKITTIIKNYKLINYQVMEGTIKSAKFKVMLTFDGIIQKGKTMTINELAKIVTEGFIQVNKRLDNHEEILKQHSITLEKHSQILEKHSQILEEHSKILEKHSLILEEHSKILEEHSKILEKHSDIFKRNNLK